MPKPSHTAAWFIDNTTIDVGPMVAHSREINSIKARIHILDTGCDVTDREGDALGSFARLPDALAFARRWINGKVQAAQKSEKMNACDSKGGGAHPLPWCQLGDLGAGNRKEWQETTPPSKKSPMCIK
jgi:hypothetical protein